MNYLQLIEEPVEHQNYFLGVQKQLSEDFREDLRTATLTIY